MVGTSASKDPTRISAFGSSGHVSKATESRLLMPSELYESVTYARQSSSHKVLPGPRFRAVCRAGDVEATQITYISPLRLGLH
jgi:hypothetical protein